MYKVTSNLAITLDIMEQMHKMENYKCFQVLILNLDITQRRNFLILLKKLYSRIRA